MRSARGAVAALAAASLLISVLVGAGFSTLAQIREGVAARTQIFTVVILADDLLSELKDAETGQRGYLLTGDETFLQPWTATQSVASDHLTQLLSLTQSSDARSHETSMRPLLDAKLRELSETIEMRRHGDLQGATARVSAGDGKRLMDAIRVETRGVVQAETERLAEREEALSSNIRRSILLMGIVCLGALGSALAFAHWIRRESQHRVTLKVLEYENVALVTASRQRSELRQSEELFRLLVDGITDYAIYMLDPAGKVVSWNTGAQRLKGYSTEEVLGQDVSIFFLPEDVAAGHPRAELTRAAAEGRTEQEAWRLRKDGSRFRAHVVVTALRDGEDQLRGFAKVTLDITARQATEDRLRAYATKLERSNRELETFASVASHDLQEPLRKIRSFGDRLMTRDAERLDPTGRDHLERMVAAAARMQDLIENLLTFSRVTTKAQPFALVDLGTIAREALSDLESRVAQTAGQVELGALPVLYADATQMRQLFQNLLGNALKFHRAGVPPVVRAGSKALPGGDCWEVWVEDNGLGFEPQYAERIFGLFQRLHGRSEYEGTGIGLAICRKIVERHHGTIIANGVPGEGARFTLTLPYRQPEEIALP